MLGKCEIVSEARDDMENGLDVLGIAGFMDSRQICYTRVNNEAPRLSPGSRPPNYGNWSTVDPPLVAAAACFERAP